jgi:hypothetical protein
MDPKTSSVYFAPSGSGSGAVQFPGMQQPRLDEHLVEGETREEMLRGERIYAAPAREPHAERHFELDYVIRAHVQDGYIGASDMLTRAGPGSEFATDTAVRKRGIDPETDTRYLEELAFEVVSTQSMREMIMRAEDLSNRGVRRLLAIFVARNEVCEWSVAEHRFVTLSLGDSLVDPTLARPIPIRALLDAAQADNAVVDALDSKGNPRLRAIKTREREEGREEGLAKGLEEGLAKGLEQGLTKGLEQGREGGLVEGIESICRILGIELSPERRAGLHELDTAGLERLLTRLETERRWL